MTPKSLLTTTFSLMKCLGLSASDQLFVYVWVWIQTLFCSINPFLRRFNSSTNCLVYVAL